MVKLKLLLGMLKLEVVPLLLPVLLVPKGGNDALVEVPFDCCPKVKGFDAVVPDSD